MARRLQGMDQISKSDLAAIHNIARTALGIAGITDSDLKDIEQELTLKLIRKAHLFRKRIQSWPTFRRSVLTNCLSDIIKIRSRPGFRKCYVECRSLNEVFSEDIGPESEEIATLGDMLTSEGLVCDNTEKPELPGVDLKVDMENYLGSLPNHYREICEMLKTCSIRETMNALRIPRTTFYRYLNDIKKGLKKAGFDAYI